MAVPLTGQVAVGATAQKLDSTGTASRCVGFTIRAPLSNAHAVFLGGAAASTTTGYQLDPGDSITYERRSATGEPVYQLRPSDFWAVGTAGDIVTWLASP